MFLINLIFSNEAGKEKENENQNKINEKYELVIDEMAKSRKKSKNSSSH